MRSASFALGAALLAFGCTVDTQGSGPAGLGSAGHVAGAGGSPASGGSSVASGGSSSVGSGGSSASGGSNPSGTGGATAGTNSGPGNACGKIWYNGESGEGDVNLADGDAWSDPWKDPMQGTSQISESKATPHGGTSSLEIDLNWSSNYYGGAFGFNFARYNRDGSYDVHGEADLEFWIRTETGNKAQVSVWLIDADKKVSNRIDVTSSSPVTPQWRKVSIPLTQFTGVDLTAIWEVDADTHADPFGMAGGVKFFIDDGAFTTPGCR